MNTEIEIFKRGELILPADMVASDWMDVGRHIRIARKSCVTWWAQWRKYGASKYGEEFVQDTESQLELELGIEAAPRPQLNPADKSTAIVTIEGIRQKFDLWERKMRDEIPTWDEARLRKALDLLSPMEEKARQIRDLLSGQKYTHAPPRHQESPRI